jgi:hypothetical protein
MNASRSISIVLACILMPACSRGPEKVQQSAFEDFPDDTITMSVLGDEDGTISAIRQFLSNKLISSTVVVRQNKYVITNFVSEKSEPADRIRAMASARVGVNQDATHQSCTILNVSTLIRRRGIHEESRTPINDGGSVEPLISQTLREFVDTVRCRR